MKVEEAMQTLEEVLKFDSQTEVLDSPELVELVGKSGLDGFEKFSKGIDLVYKYSTTAKKMNFFSKMLYEASTEGVPKSEEFEKGKNWLRNAKSAFKAPYCLMAAAAFGIIGSYNLAALIPAFPLAIMYGVYHIEGARNKPSYVDTEENAFPNELGRFKSKNNPELYVVIEKYVSEHLEAIDEIYDGLVEIGMGEGRLANALLYEHEAVVKLQSTYSEVAKTLITHNMEDFPRLGFVLNDYVKKADDELANSITVDLGGAITSFKENFSEGMDQYMKEIGNENP